MTALVIVTTSVASAQSKYFYSHNGKAYYCVQPQSYMEGCYVVCDDTKVVRVNGYPTISSHRAEELKSACCGSTTPHTVQCGPTTPNCLPRLAHKCHCTAPGEPVPITGEQGPLETYCDAKSFYRGIEEREATVPVPQICVNAHERYNFRPLTLEFDCKDADCPDLKCDFEKCGHDCCVVKTCEVYQCVTDCKLECKLLPQEGTVLIAVRRAQVNGKYVADVVIGRAGKMDFGAYPENTVILQAATEAQIRSAINLVVDLSTIAGTTDLKSLIN